MSLVIDMVYTSTTPIAPTSETAAPQSTFETTLSAALEHARRLTEMTGGVGTDVAIAWETVEELQTAQARRASLETTLSAALEHARRLTEMTGGVGTDVAIAWETVEELQTAQARKASPQTEPSSAFERYCTANPEAPECRIYDC